MRSSLRANGWCIVSSVIARSAATKQSILSLCGKIDCFASLAMTVLRDLGLFDLFAQHFKFQPFVFGFLQFPLRFCQRIGGLIELLAVLLEQIGVVKMPLLFGDFGL